MRDAARMRAGRLGWAGMVLVLLAAPCAGQDAPSAPTVQMLPGPQNDLRRAVFEVVGLDDAEIRALAKSPPTAERWTRLLSVSIDRGAAMVQEPGPALPGTYRVVDGVLRFEPKGPLQWGTRYRATFDPRQLPGRRIPASGPITVIHRLPARAPR